MNEIIVKEPIIKELTSEEAKKLIDTKKGLFQVHAQARENINNSYPKVKSGLPYLGSGNGFHYVLINDNA